MKKASTPAAPWVPGRRRALLTVGGFGLLGSTGLGLPARSIAQERYIKFILPNATGSGVDTITRSAQAALGKALGHSVVVENQPGAGGIVGLQALARAAPDGTTLSVVSNNVVIFPSVYKALPFAMPADFTPIAICGFTPVLLLVNPKVPAKNAQELTALLKSRPGEINYASSGNGTILHLAAAMYLDQVGATARHVPYKGVGPMLTDLIGGHVDFATAALPSVQGHINSGALRAIGAATSQRIEAAADIPTFVEQGVPNYVVEAWFAVIGPKGMKDADVARIRQAIATAFDAPEVRESMGKQGNVIKVSTTEYAQKFFSSEMAKYADLVKKAGVEPQ
jgi:tripartite-type tricarboxylate transporter receptor subunit TctC